MEEIFLHYYTFNIGIVEKEFALSPCSPSTVRLCEFSKLKTTIFSQMITVMDKSYFMLIHIFPVGLYPTCLNR